MGKRIRVQRRGRGSPTFTAPTHRRVAPVQYPATTEKQREGVVRGEIKEIVHESGRGAPLGLVELETGEAYHTVIPEGMFEGQQIEIGSRAAVDVGNVLPLSAMPEGTMICNIELSPDDGGKMARSSGAYAMVVAHTPDGTIVKLPSGKNRYVNDLCRATVGVASGAGRVEKPFLKAGDKFYLKKAKGQLYPRTRGKAMIAAAHPYGSSKRGARKVTTVSRHAPPGKKVGLIAARGAGRKKRKKR